MRISSSTVHSRRSASVASATSSVERGPIMSAIPHELVESTLFGHERGAFTGAVKQQLGKFELAAGGTLFLDEIGDLRFDLQAKLLRAIQEGEIERVGGTKPIRTDFRLIAATNIDLDRAVKENRFREDLYYRINVIPIRMTLVPLPQLELVGRLRKGDFDAFLFEMAGRTLNWANFFWHSSDNGPFDSGYQSTDAVLDRIRLARSDEEIRSGVADFFQILHDDPPAVFLTFGERTRAVSRNFDVAGETGRDIVPIARNWRVARQ